MKPFYLEDSDKFNKFKKEPFAFTFITFASAPIVEHLIKQKETEVGSFQQSSLR